MELVVFDLDGTLLNSHSQISSFTRDTLGLMADNNIAYTVATGRTLNSAQDIIHGHGFELPHIYSNGVIVWDPRTQSLQLDNCLTVDEVNKVLSTSITRHITPFISAVNAHNQHFIYHPPVQNATEEKLLALFSARPNVQVLSLDTIPHDIAVTNISLIGQGEVIDGIHHEVNSSTQLIAYSGPAIEGNGLKWMDMHHRNANKGSAIETLKEALGAKRIICFGDSDNDLSMFSMADESYAPSNAHPHLKAAATHVIGHHHEDGVAHYLRERFNL